MRSSRQPGGVPIKRSDANDKDGQLINGDFAEGINGFEVYSFVPEDISYNANAEDGFSIDISDTGEEDWHIQLKQGGIRLQKGKWYEITLDAKSSLNRSILCSMQRDGTNDNNWTSYSGAENLALTKQWKTYKITFQMTENTDESAIFNLAMGTVDGKRIKTKHTVGIKNIKLKQLADNWMDQLTEDNNLLKNAGFAYKGILWEPVVIAPGAADTSFANGEAAFHISNTGEEDWHIQLKQGGVKLQQNKWYQITLDAKSSMDRSILCSMQRDGTDDGNWTSYSGSKNMKLTNQWKTYKVIFQMTENTDERAIFNLAMGAVDGNKIKSKHTVGIKNVKLEELADNWMDQLNQGGNLLKNADFGYEDILWEPSVVAPGEAKTSFADGKAVFDISNVGTIDWHVQLKQSGITLEQGSGYRLTFKASSSVPRQISVGFMDKDYVNWYGGEMVKLTPEEQTVTIEFYMDKATDTDVRMFLSMGKIENENTPASVITLSDFSLVKANVAKTMGYWGGGGGGGGGWSEPIVHFNDGFTLSYWFGKVGQCREVNGEYQIEILDTGTEGWHVQLQKAGMKLEKGKQYRMSFDAKSTVPREIYCAMQRDGTTDDDWTEYSSGGGTCQLGSDWQTFNIEFTMDKTTDSNALYNISLGAVNGKITTPHTVSFRKLKLEDMANVPIESVPLNKEMLKAGKWTFNCDSSKGNIITENNGTFTAKINDVGSNDYDVQIIQDNLTLEGGCTYEFTCKASFAAPQSKTRANSATRKIKVGLMDPNNNYDHYGGGDMEIDGTTKECKVTIPVPEDKPTIRSGRLAISMGKTEEGTPTGTVTVGDISLKKTKNPEKLIADVDGNMLKGKSMDFRAINSANATQAGTKVTVESLGDQNNSDAWQDYYIQLSTTGLNLEKGATYKFTADASFAAKAGEGNDTRRISIGCQNASDYTGYGNGKPEITSNSRQIEVEFTMNNNTDSNSMLYISMGQIREGGEDSAKTPTPLGTISLSNLCLKKTADAPPVSNLKLIAETEGNMLTGKTQEFYVEKNTGSNNPPATATQNETKFTVESLGSKNHHIQFKVNGLTLEKGAAYEITADASFDASDGDASKKRKIVIGFSGSPDRNYDWYCGEEKEISSAGGQIKVDLEMPKDTDNNASFVISMGQMKDGSGNTITTPLGTITLSNLCVKKTKDAPKDLVLIANTANNMLKDQNPYFHYESSASANARQDGTKFTVENLGNEEYHIQFGIPGLTLKKGATYKFTADASFAASDSSVSGTRIIKIGCMNNDPDPGDKWYGGGEPQITSTSQSIEFEFTMTKDTDSNSKLYISMGKIDDSTPLGTITLSNLCLVETSGTSGIALTAEMVDSLSLDDPSESTVDDSVSSVTDEEGADKANEADKTDEADEADKTGKTDKTGETDKTGKTDKTGEIAEGTKGGEDKKENNPTPNRDVQKPGSIVENENKPDEKDVTGSNETPQKPETPADAIVEDKKADVEQTEQVN